MLDDHEFCDTCPGCRPAMLDVRTGKRLPDDDPKMTKVNRVWDNDTTYEQRKAFIEVTLHNSRKPGDMRGFQAVSLMIEAALLV